jgi:hypothetical protein
VPRRHGALESSEDPLVVVLGDAEAVVLHRDLDRVVDAHHRHRDRPMQSELERVAQEAGDHLLDAQQVPLADHAVGGQNADLTPRRPGLFLEAIHHPTNEVTEIEPLGREPYLSFRDAPDVDEALRQALEASHLLAGRRDSSDESQVRDARCFELPGKGVELELQRRQRSSELVRCDLQELVAHDHALAKAVFHPLSLRQVPGDLAEAAKPTVGVADGRREDARPEPRTILPQPPAFVLGVPLPCRDLELPRGPSGRDPFGRREDGEVSPDDLARRAARHSLGPRVPRAHGPFGRE